MNVIDAVSNLVSSNGMSLLRKRTKNFVITLVIAGGSITAL